MPSLFSLRNPKELWKNPISIGGNLNNFNEMPERLQMQKDGSSPCVPILESDCRLRANWVAASLDLDFKITNCKHLLYVREPSKRAVGR